MTQEPRSKPDPTPTPRQSKTDMCIPSSALPPPAPSAPPNSTPPPSKQTPFKVVYTSKWPLGQPFPAGHRNHCCLAISRQVASGRFLQGVSCDDYLWVFRTAIWGSGIPARRKPKFPAWANAREISCGRAGFRREGAGRCAPGREQSAETGHEPTPFLALLPSISAQSRYADASAPDAQTDTPSVGPAACLYGLRMSCHAHHADLPLTNASVTWHTRARSALGRGRGGFRVTPVVCRLPSVAGCC